MNTGERKRVLDSVREYSHQELQKDGGQAAMSYLAYIAERYDGATSSAAAASSAAAIVDSERTSQPIVKRAATNTAAAAAAASESAIASGVGLNAGEGRFVIPELNKLSKRRDIPREDGIDPRRPDAPPYDTTWMRDWEDREELVLQHPLYQFMMLFAGHANISRVQRLFNVAALESRAIRGQAITRIAELERRIAETNLSQLEKDRTEMMRQQTLLLQGEERERFERMENSAKLQLERARSQNTTKLSTIQTLRAKYNTLNDLFKTWSQYSLVPNMSGGLVTNAPGASTASDQWLTIFAGRAAEPERQLLKDFLYGISFSKMERIAAQFRLLFDRLDRQQVSGGRIIRIAEIPTDGEALLNILEVYENDVMGAEEPLIAHLVQARSALRRFNFDAGGLADLSALSSLPSEIDDLDQQLNAASVDENEYLVETLTNTRLRLKQRLDAVTVKVTAAGGIIIDSVVWRAVESLLESLEQYVLWRFQLTGWAEFMNKFGGVVPVQRVRGLTQGGDSPTMLRAIDTLTEQEKDINAQIKQSFDDERRIDDRLIELAKSQALVDQLQASIAERGADVDRYRQELSDLQRRYVQNYQWVSRPENSGVVDLDERTIAALNDAYSLAKDAVNSGNVKLDAFMTSPDVMNVFAKLAATIYKLNGFTSGSQYTQQHTEQRNDEVVNTLVLTLQSDFVALSTDRVVKRPALSGSVRLGGRLNTYDLARQNLRRFGAPTQGGYGTENSVWLNRPFDTRK